MIFLKSFLIALLSLCLISCFYGKKQDNIELLIQEFENTKDQEIEPLPVFGTYKTFSYSASNIKSPFAPPVEKTEDKIITNNVKPNLKRKKTPLEGIDIKSFSYVGSMSKNNQIWGLVRTNSGVYRVKQGDYLGQNYGKIQSISEQEIRIVEIISTGSHSWIEKQRVMKLKKK